MGSNAVDASALARRYEEAQKAWPGVVVSAEAFAAYVAERIASPNALDGLHASDLYLACACVAGDPRALQLFDAKVLSEVPRYVARLSADADFVDRVRQLLREKLLMPGAGAKLREYRGRGPLGGWIRVAAIRTALNEQRADERAAGRAAAEAPAVREPLDPELELLKAHYMAEVKEAFEATLRALSTDARNVLRMHYLDGATIDEIAAVYDVHRSTAARWISESRAAILDEARHLLRERLKGTPSEVESILRLVDSCLDVSARWFWDEN
jgi:RNA polymerase sigma-70 factor (ECF subfamily)